MIDNCNFKKIVDILPCPFVIANGERKILFANKSFLNFANKTSLDTSQRLGEVISCENSREKGCGFSIYCSKCLIKRSIENVIYRGEEIIREKVKFTYNDGEKRQDLILLISATGILCEKDKLVALIIEDISDYIKLRGMIPICSNCKKIKTDLNEWVNFEKFLKDKIGDDLFFSHGLCRDCYEKLSKKYLKEDEK